MIDIFVYDMFWFFAVAALVGIAAAIIFWGATKKARAQEKKAKDAEISYQNALAELKCSTKHIWATYKFSESDFNKFGPDHRAMEREARQRMACALGRRIVKELGATELIEKGVLIGYKIEVDVRKCKQPQQPTPLETELACPAVPPMQRPYFIKSKTI